MKRWLIIVSLCNWQSLGAQVPAFSDAQLIRRYDLSCGYSCAQELAIDLGQATGRTSTPSVAMRFCSRDSFPVALSTAATDYRYVISILQDSYGYTPERISLLRSENCVGSRAGVTATEFWIVPNGKTLPASVESRSAKDVHVDTTVVKTMADYEAALQKLKHTLLDNSQTVGVVVGSYYKRPATLLRRRLRIAENALKEHKTLNGRYFVRLALSTTEHSSTAPEPEYPKLFLVGIEKSHGMARK